MSLASSKRAGERSEGAAIEMLPVLRYVAEEEHYDAVARDDHGDVDAGDRIEIKSAAVVISEDRAGKWFLRERQHDQLLEDDGWYLFLVCTPNADRRILAYAFKRARHVDRDLLPAWWDGGDRSDYRQIPWTAVFDPDEIEGVET